MSSFGQITLKRVRAMLKICAPGHEFIDDWDHYYCIKYAGQTFPSLPKRRQIQVGHVKKMARHLGILDCAKKHLDV